MNAKQRYTSLSLVIALLATNSVASTHIHVIHVDGRTPSGRPAIGATVEYAVPNGSRVHLDTTDADGVATGEIDPSLVGRTITLYIDGDDDRGGTFSEQKQITIKSVDEMEKGYVVTVVPTVGDSAPVAMSYSAQTSTNICNMECPQEFPSHSQCYIQSDWCTVDPGAWYFMSNGQWMWIPYN